MLRITVAISLRRIIYKKETVTKIISAHEANTLLQDYWTNILEATWTAFSMKACVQVRDLGPKVMENE